MDPSLYKPETFAPHVNTDFTTAIDGQALKLRLTEVMEGQSNERVLQFSIFFLGPLTPVLEQRLYRLEHAQLGDMELFLVPIARDADGMKYQAVFSRFREGQAPKRP